MKSVIVFNHISENLTENEITKLKRWYMNYHKLCVCYKWKYRKSKRLRLSLYMCGTGLTVIGVIVGGVTLNPIVLGCVSGCGIMVQGYVTKSNLSKKVEYCRFAYTSYEKVLTQLKSYLSGLPHDDATLLSDLKVLDDIVTDLCPPVNGMSDKYDKIYGSVYDS